MRALLADDEPLALRRLQRLAAGSPELTVVGTASDGSAALEAARRLRPEIVVLDIDMPGRSGMEVAAELAGPDAPQVIFLTAFERFAAAAFAVEAVDYLLKPVSPDRFRDAVLRAVRRHAERTALNAPAKAASSGPLAIHVPDVLGGHDVAISEIVWIEAAKDYVLIHTISRSHMLRSTMGEIAGRLPPPIVRVHRSAFANVDRVVRVSRPEKGLLRIHLRDGPSLSIGPSYSRHVARLLRDRNA